MSAASRPETFPPRGDFETLTRFARSVEDVCPTCEGVRVLDVWINEGGSDARAVCRDCGTEHPPEVLA